MRQFLLIDCRTPHAARYEGRRQGEMVKLPRDFDDMSIALQEIDAFRRHGHAGLAVSTQPEDPRRA